MEKFVDYVLLDQKVCQLASSIESNILSCLAPSNLKSEKKRFFHAIEKKEEYNPSFSYPPRNPIYAYFSISRAFSTYKHELKELLPQLGMESLSLLFEKKILDLFENMELIRSIGSPNFANNSEEYFGAVEKKTVSLAEDILKKRVSLGENRSVGPERAAAEITSFLNARRIPYKVVIKESVAKFSVNHFTREITVSDSLLISENELRRAIVHEIEAHVYRSLNGAMQPYKIFSKGLSKETTETDEGLAVFVEKAQGVILDSQLRNYAGRVLAINIAGKKSFYETFQELRAFFSEEDAYYLTLRAKRGTFDQSVGGAFTKDALYLKGMVAVEEYLEKRDIGELYMGRYSVYDVPLVLDVDGLKKPKHLPDFVLEKEK